MQSAMNLFWSGSGSESGSRSTPSPRICEFQRLGLLGKGSYGSVFLVMKSGGYDNSKMFAMKETRNNLDAVRELEVLTAIRHQEFLVQLHYNIEREGSMFLIMDYLPGENLGTHLDHGKFHLEEARFYVGEIVVALEHLHNLGIVHRDLKLDNIMLDHEGHIVLVDFGCAVQFARHDRIRKVLSSRLIGTPAYTSPEVLNYEPHGMPVDLWALGILTHLLVAQAEPFSANTMIESMQRIKTDNPTIDPSLTIQTTDFILKLLIKDPDWRFGSYGGTNELMRHDFFEGIDWSVLRRRGYSPPIVVREGCQPRSFNSFY